VIPSDDADLLTALDRKLPLPGIVVRSRRFDGSAAPFFIHIDTD
jgi:hypothetical protein